MISKFLVLTALIFYSTQSYSSSDDFFRIAPYTLKHTQGNLLLNFQINQDSKLIIEDNGESFAPTDYKKNQQYKLGLNSVPCGSTKEIKILNAQNSEVLYKNSQPAEPCDSFSSNLPFVFGFISDTQQFRDRHEDIAKTIAYHNSVEPLQFIINGGDVVQDGDIEQDWIDFFIGGKSYLRDIPIIAAIGNHDYRGAKGATIPKFFKQFMRWDGADEYGNLFFDFPEVQFLILNSNFSQLSLSEEMHTWNWIEEKLKRAQKIHKAIVVATHFPVYASSVNRFYTLNIMKMRTILVPLLEKYKAALVLSGHTHMYERSFKDGINYIIAGPAGGKPNHPTYNNKYQKFIDQDSLTFTKIKLYQKVFTIETYNQDNKFVDGITIDLNKQENNLL